MVEVEDVVGVVPPLDLDEPVVVRAVGRSDGVLGLIVAEVVEPAAVAEVRLRRSERLAAPGDVRLAVGGVPPHGRNQEVPALLAVGHRGLGYPYARHRAVEVLEQDRRQR